MVAIVQGSAKLSANLDPYGQLMRMLMPRAQGIAVYAASGATLWVADGQDDPDMHRLAADAISEGVGAPLDIDGFLRPFDGPTAYAFRLRD